jgi:hypothetical protein
MGTQVLYDAGYDPRALAQFFEKLEAETKGKNPPEFLSDHPNPDHRVERVMEEIDKLGGPPPNAKKDSADFEAIKREVLALPVAKKAPRGTGGGPVQPSGKFIPYEGDHYALKYPENWAKYPDKDGGISFAPDGGIVPATSNNSDNSGGAQSSSSGGLAYGLITGTLKFDGDPNDADALQQATQQLISNLQQSNPKLQVARQSSRVRLNKQHGLSVFLTNESPAGGPEIDWLITVLRPEGLVYFICVAPQPAYPGYEQAFNAILDSVRFFN